MVNSELLTKAGIDVSEFVKRIMGNETLVKVFIEKFITDKNYDKLKEALSNDDFEKAHSASHTLKGMCGNMSLNKLFELFSNQVNLIRQGEKDKAKAMMEEIDKQYENTIIYMKKWLEMP